MPTSLPRPPRWRAAFLRELMRTGNVRLACEGALVNHTYLYRYRKAVPEFAAAWDTALAEAGRRLAATRDGGRPPRGQHVLRGHEMQVIGGHGAIPPRMVAASPRRFTQAKQKAFLEMLAATANVTASARHAGISPEACYWQRQRRPDFAQLWADAIEMGVLNLEWQR